MAPSSGRARVGGGALGVARRAGEAGEGLESAGGDVEAADDVVRRVGEVDVVGADGDGPPGDEGAGVRGDLRRRNARGDKGRKR